MKLTPTERDRRPVELPKTEGLTELDRDRAASVASEGGASAATVEAQKPVVKEPAKPMAKKVPVAKKGGPRKASDRG
jgi:hypothetical protein